MILLILKLFRPGWTLLAPPRQRIIDHHGWLSAGEDSEYEACSPKSNPRSLINRAANCLALARHLEGQR